MKQKENGKASKICYNTTYDNLQVKNTVQKLIKKCVSSWDTEDTEENMEADASQSYSVLCWQKKINSSVNRIYTISCTVCCGMQQYM